jgi:hypothetical protein
MQRPFNGLHTPVSKSVDAGLPRGSNSSQKIADCRRSVERGGLKRGIYIEGGREAGGNRSAAVGCGRLKLYCSLNDPRVCKPSRRGARGRQDLQRRCETADELSESKYPLLRCRLMLPVGCCCCRRSQIKCAVAAQQRCKAFRRMIRLVDSMQPIRPSRRPDGRELGGAQWVAELGNLSDSLVGTSGPNGVNSGRLVHVTLCRELKIK